MQMPHEKHPLTHFTYPLYLISFGLDRLLMLYHRLPGVVAPEPTMTTDIA